MISSNFAQDLSACSCRSRYLSAACMKFSSTTLVALRFLSNCLGPTGLLLNFSSSAKRRLSCRRLRLCFSSCSRRRRCSSRFSASSACRCFSIASCLFLSSATLLALAARRAASSTSILCLSFSASASCLCRSSSSSAARSAAFFFARASSSFLWVSAPLSRSLFRVREGLCKGNGGGRAADACGTQAPDGVRITTETSGVLSSAFRGSFSSETLRLKTAGFVPDKLAKSGTESD
mmetsp:Transcript_18105/g.26193  ORF Transcript_18105/g.26193 Transcript_18105/m.26193 type:complete len:235 (-) Transcript_18105:543-1247(-)